MKKEIIEINKTRGVYRITTPDERWYTISVQNRETGLPEYKYIPSTTWITNYVYKGLAYYRWLAEKKNWDEAEAIKNEAADRGSKIHQALEILIGGASVTMEDKFRNNTTEQDEELKAEEYEAVLAFKNWYDEIKPEFLLKETTVISGKYNFAGTVDCVAKIDGQIYIIDWKTSQYVWPSMEAQISSYKQAFSEMGHNTKNIKLAILQLGYKRNKKGFKFTEVEDQFENLFISAQKFWEKENKDKSPKQVEYPLSISLNLDLGASEKPKEAKMSTPTTKTSPRGVGLPTDTPIQPGAKSKSKILTK